MKFSALAMLMGVISAQQIQDPRFLDFEAEAATTDLFHVTVSEASIDGLKEKLAAVGAAARQLVKP